MSTIPPWLLRNNPPPLVDPRPIPPGWIQSYDRSEDRYFYTDTNFWPHKSFWEHPCDRGYDPAIYGRRFTCDEVLAGRKHGYRISHGFEWLRNLDPPPESQLRYRWRNPIEAIEQSSDNEDGPAGIRQRRRRRGSQARRGRGNESSRVQPDQEATASGEEQERLSSTDESAAVDSGSRQGPSNTDTDANGSSSRRTSGHATRSSQNQTQGHHSVQHQSQSSDQRPAQSFEQPLLQTSGQILPQPLQQPSEQPVETERTYAASDLDYPNIPQGGIYLIPRSLNPWVPSPPPPPPPPYSSPTGSQISDTLVPSPTHPQAPEHSDFGRSGSEDSEQSNQPEDPDMRFYRRLNRGINMAHRGVRPPRTPPASPTGAGRRRDDIDFLVIPQWLQAQQANARNNRNINADETANIADDREGEPSNTVLPRDQEACFTDPPTIMDRFRRALHLHVPSAAEKAAKKLYKKTQRAQKEAEISDRNQRRYEAAAERIQKQSELFQEMNRREREIYQAKALKEKIGFAEDVFQKKLAEIVRINGDVGNDNHTSIAADAAGSDVTPPNPIAVTRSALDTSMPGNLRPSPNAPIAMAVDEGAEARRDRNADTNPNILTTPVPSPPRYYGEAPRITSDTMWRRHAEDLRNGPFIRNYCTRGDETDPRYGAFGSGRFGAGSDAGVRWMINNRGFRRPPNKPAIYGRDIRRHPHFFDYAEYDEHEWGGGGGIHGASMNCAW